MLRYVISGLSLYFTVILLSGQEIRTDTVSVAPFGKVFVYSSGTENPQNLIIMISGDGGWKYGVPEFASEFSRLNPVVAGAGFLLLPDRRLGNDWIVLQGIDDKECNFETVNEFVSGCSDSKLIALESVGHGFSDWKDFMPQWKDALVSF